MSRHAKQRERPRRLGQGQPLQLGYDVREAGPADLEAVLTMKAAAWREAYGHLRDESFFAEAESSLPQQVERWQRFLERDGSLWLAEDGRGRVVGMASGGPAREDRHTADSGSAAETQARTAAEAQPVHTAGSAARALPPTELHALYVLAEAYGTGVADALLHRAVGDLPCRLWVLSGNERAGAFYRRHGFSGVGAPVPMAGSWEGLSEQLMARRGA